ncbi:MULTISPECIES: PilZ domain-containing protein [Pseudomonadaceae]|uniref:Type IV pilus assembly PilZ n=1 Tax=Pseudomonas saudiphocaensis TaxID=1499686 RepID=A0A078LUH4_9PSED|nr:MULTISPECIES: PilZ domain-containing protein [Pseudomonadaceae]MBE7926812.1 PilZ domain-containing protein [Pseudomonas saudiphocaensis]MCF6783631.1 PilZ domain-containing protein [Stutzerimonas stutzeri]MCF6806481.1 PilZ domain-containing protein [Stutzerimonas stutzeri]RRV12156.1 PilZ domain-containing protein [Pseudomonas saudiphocaensis]CDZ93942.1 type IV pilus assembly PilZ [Pseudomonas saudiphocaensis]
MTQSDRYYSEKRDFIRMQVETVVSLTHGGQTCSGVCLDLSSTGMQVLADTSLQLGDKVQIHIPSSHSELQGLDATTEVVRVGTHEDGRQTLGLAILAMS